jgi:Flp pilus assembly protein TadD
MRAIPFRFQLGPGGSDPGADLPGSPELRALRLAADSNPHDPDYQFILGDALLRVGRCEEALPALREAVSLHPEDPEYHRCLGEAAFRAGRYEEAFRAFENAVLRSGGTPASHNGLGGALLGMGRGLEAVASLEAAQYLSPECGPISSNLGIALWRLNRREKAIVSLEKGVAQSRDSVECQWNLAVALAEQALNSEADAHLRQVVRLAPGDIEAHALRGDVLYRQGSVAEAGRAFREALRLDPRSLDARPDSQQAYDLIRLGELRRGHGVAPSRGHPIGFAWSGVVDLFRRAHGLLGLVGSLVWLAIAVLLVSALVVAGRPFVQHFLLKDRAVSIAHSALIGHDDELFELLMHAVHERDLDRYIHKENCSIATLRDLRRIQCAYEEPVRLLPGYAPTLHFVIDVQEPFVGDESAR